jgi:hypothetical protein
MRQPRGAPALSSRGNARVAEMNVEPWGIEPPTSLVRALTNPHPRAMVQFGVSLAFAEGDLVVGASDSGLGVVPGATFVYDEAYVARSLRLGARVLMIRIASPSPDLLVAYTTVSTRPSSDMSMRQLLRSTHECASTARSSPSGSVKPVSSTGVGTSPD